MLKNFLDPKWIFFINLIPSFLLILILSNEYTIINKFLESLEVTLWKYFTISFFLMTGLNSAYSIYSVLKKKDVSLFYGILSIFIYIIFLYSYSIEVHGLFPFRIPRWMLPDEVSYYAGTFLMPSCAYSLIIIIIKTTPKEKSHSIILNFLPAILIPVFLYIYAVIILPMWRARQGYEYSKVNEHIFIIMLVVLMIAFLFFIIRTIFILEYRKGKSWSDFQLIWKIPFSLIFPILGLLLNNGQLNKISSIDFSSGGIFGDFSSPWFYILAVLNGIFICLPNNENKLYRQILFVGRSITLSYTFYFFMVFLPFLPLSLFAVIIAGAGFLMLSPLVLMAIHLRTIATDIEFLSGEEKNRKFSMILLAGFLTIPIIITINYKLNKINLHEALDYIYNPDYSKDYKIDKSNILSTLSVIESIKENKAGGRNLNSGNGTPYLTTYLNWLVLDNLTISDGKLQLIQKIFLGKTNINLMNQNLSQNQTRTVKISSLNSKSVYNENSNTWKTWVDLELIADDKAFPQGEFSTTISLPPGTWISDYYLYVGDRKEPGILVEKKSATWIYNQIRNERRDPGILYYTSANRTAFKVFPFGPKEIRKTGIEFIHREPVNIQIGNRSVHLGDPEIISSQVPFQSENAFYLSAKEKSALSKTQRKPVYYVIIDTSVGKEIHQDKFSKIIDIMIRKNNISESNLIFNFTNTFVMSENFSSDWKVKYKKQKFEGGFFLERAIKKSLFDAYTKNKNKYPVIIVLSDSLENAILEKDFSNFGFVYPESDIFYFIDPKGRLSSVQYSSPKKILQKENKLNINYEVLVWPNPEKPEAYLADDGLPGIIFKDQFPNINKPDLKEKDWFSAISISALENHILLHPEKSDSEWLNLVRYSFISRVMNSFTSYIVVETEAQKEILKRKQEQVLNSNKSLDLEEDSTRRMSEPGIWIFLFILGGGYIYRMIRSKRI